MDPRGNRTLACSHSSFHSICESASHAFATVRRARQRVGRAKCGNTCCITGQFDQRYCLAASSPRSHRENHASPASSLFASWIALAWTGYTSRSLDRRPEVGTPELAQQGPREDLSSYIRHDLKDGIAFLGTDAVFIHVWELDTLMLMGHSLLHPLRWVVLIVK